MSDSTDYGPITAPTFFSIDGRSSTIWRQTRPSKCLTTSSWEGLCCGRLLMHKIEIVIALGMVTVSLDDWALLPIDDGGIASTSACGGIRCLFVSMLAISFASPIDNFKVRIRIFELSWFVLPWLRYWIVSTGLIAGRNVCFLSSGRVNPHHHGKLPYLTKNSLSNVSRLHMIEWSSHSHHNWITES